MKTGLQLLSAILSILSGFRRYGAVIATGIPELSIGVSGVALEK